jgi:aspartyl aminopeptidase
MNISPSPSEIADAFREQAQALLDFIDMSPSPWHAVKSIKLELQGNGFVELKESMPWALTAGGKYFVTRGGSSLLAFICGQLSLPETGFRIIGAHTDSPGFRVKPRGPHGVEHLLRVGVEIYGGPIVASFADRDLSLAGRVFFRHTDTGQCYDLIRFENPVLRLPNLAIHMNRAVNEEGLKFHKQNELPLMWGDLDTDSQPQQQFRDSLAAQANVDPDAIINWELSVYDTQKGAIWGSNSEFIANSQIDNLASCHAALSAISNLDQPPFSCVCGFFDHEEVGSESVKGAGGSFLYDVCQRIALSLDPDACGMKIALANSVLVSADMAHAFHPNFPGAYEPYHHVNVNAGPVVKTNANQRYATDGETEALFIELCQTAGVPYQQYSHRTDLGCGSTIGPMLSAELGIRTVDVGNPMWAMHSARESAGVKDHSYMISVLRTFLQQDLTS